jgi:hypothetical protein
MARKADPAQVQKIDGFLQHIGSPMAGHARELVEAGHRYGVDPSLILAISAAETSFGTAPNTGTDVSKGHNAWGWGPHIHFEDWAHAFDAVAHGLRAGYLGKGLTTPEAIAPKWAPASDGNDPAHWASTVRAAYGQITGSDYTPTAAPAAAQAQAPAARHPLELDPIDLTKPNDTLQQAADLRRTALKSSALEGFSALASGHYDTLQGLSTLTQSLLDAKTQANALPEPQLAQPEIPAQAAQPATPAQKQPQTQDAPVVNGHLAEAFYDPIGQWDNGRFSTQGIGGHSDHVHLSVTNPKAMLAAIHHAQSMGMSVRENPYVDPVDPVHVPDSYHYRDFPGKFQGKKLGEGLDVSGKPEQMAAFFRWALDTLR